MLHSLSLASASKQISKGVERERSADWSVQGNRSAGEGSRERERERGGAWMPTSFKFFAILGAWFALRASPSERTMVQEVSRLMSFHGFLRVLGGVRPQGFISGCFFGGFGAWFAFLASSSEHNDAGCDLSDEFFMGFGESLVSWVS
jgi:hypothetical protein